MCQTLVKCFENFEIFFREIVLVCSDKKCDWPPTFFWRCSVFSVNFHFWCVWCSSWSLTKVGFLREELECTVNQWFLQCMTLILDLLNRYIIISYKNKPHNRVRKTFTHATTHVSVCYCWCWILIPIYGKVCACMVLEKKSFLEKCFKKSWQFF